MGPALKEEVRSTRACTYEGSRLTFRGPPRPVDGDFVACLGGAGTLGRDMARPWPAVLEKRLGRPCPNLGLAEAGPEAYLADPAILEVIGRSRAAVIEVTGAQNLSNRYYRVHPRRNDRFVSASDALKALYRDVDFSQICFTGHLLTTLSAVSPRRFELVKAELQQAWLGRMRRLIDLAGPNVVLLVLPGAGSLGPEPLFVTEPLLQRLTPRVRGIVIAERDGRARADAPDTFRHERAADAAAALLQAHSFSVSSGTMVNRSPTSP